MAVTVSIKKKKSKSCRAFSILSLAIIVIYMVAEIAFTRTTSENAELFDEILSTTTTTTTTIPSTSSPVIKSDILEIRYSATDGYGADNVWYDIMMKGKEIMAANPSKGDADRLRAFEVGAHRAKQSLLAVDAGFHAYCIEPSPRSFKEIHYEVVQEMKDKSEFGKFIHLYQVAAGSDSNGEVDFRTMGGTGDHVGEFDMWNMKPGNPPEEWPEKKRGVVVKVPSKRLDDIIYNKVKPNKLDGLESGSNPPDIDRVFALKVDTQGFEPNVFDGLTESIKNHKIEYIMTEYWPNGMGLLTGKDKCEAAVGILTQLIDAGYTLYALPIEVHPKGKTKENSRARADWQSRPLNDPKADCQYILDLEKKFPVEGYFMGFWTDFLAVAPGSDPIVPKTFGYVL